MELRHIASRAGRLSSFLRGEMGMSGGLMNKLKWGDAIRVNGVPRHTDHPVQPGDVITVRLDEKQPEYPAEDGALTILYEDDHLLAVDKPSGMLIHPSRCVMTGTLANRVLGYYRRTGQQSLFHPITRLDRDTFGVVLLAKNAHVHSLVQAAGLQKTYHAITYGIPPAARGVVDAPIARRELPSLLHYVNLDGKPSITEYRVLAQSEELCKLELRPITGRTHQLRLHCFHMGCPILGDPQYCTAASHSFSEGIPLRSQQLCAVALEFLHPITGEKIHITSQMDVSFPE